MSIDLNAVEQVIADDLRFKRKLKIGRKAYRSLQSTDALQTIAGSAGAAWAGAGLAGSSVVASSFFAPTGLAAIAAKVGLITVATPIGWVVAAAVAAGGAYYGVARYLSPSEKLIDEIPRYITSSIDVLGAALFDLIGALAIRVAFSDGEYHPKERAAIIDHFVQDWGFDSRYVQMAFRDLESKSDQSTIDAVAQGLANFQASNPDCNGQAMQKELIAFLEEVIRADGLVRPGEREAIEQIASVFSGLRQSSRQTAHERIAKPVLNGANNLHGFGKRLIGR